MFELKVDKIELKVKRVELFHLRMPLVHYFETSFEKIHTRDCIIVKIFGNNEVGYGEVVASSTPFYSYETVETAWHVLKEFIIPIILNHELKTVEELAEKLAPIRGHNMAKAGVEEALFDIFAKLQNIPICKAIGGTREQIEVGVSIGIQDSIKHLIDRIEYFLTQGYRRIKVKIKPGWDIDVVKQIRKIFKSIPLMVDANCAYTLKDIDIFKCLDDFDLMMIEQPLTYDDMVDHARLQREIRTPICLDESINSFAAARTAIELGSCKIINIKAGRVGGLLNAKKIHDLCRENDIPVWCGGMLETGIGRAHNVALASLPNFVLPGDISGSHRYYQEDIIEPPIEVQKDGTIKVPKEPGLGFSVLDERINKFCLRKESFA